MVEPMFYVSEGRNKVTICGRYDEELDSYCIGVTRHGGTESYREDLGKDIALNRTHVQPYACVPAQFMGKTTALRNFNLICETIVSHIRLSKQWEPKLPRVS